MCLDDRADSHSAMNYYLAGQNPSGCGFSNHHDSSLDITGREVGMDTSVDNELKKGLVSSFEQRNILDLQGYPLHRPWY